MDHLISGGVGIGPKSIGRSGERRLSDALGRRARLNHPQLAGWTPNVASQLCTAGMSSRWKPAM
jgi:hypothetical protein